MRTSLLMLALAGVFAVSAADAQTAPTTTAGTAKAAPAKPQVKTLGNSFGDLIKAAAAQQQAQREAKAADPATAATDAKPPADAARGTEIVATTQADSTAKTP